MTGGAAVRLVDVTKRYEATGGYFGLRRFTTHAVRGVSLTVEAGSAFGLVGESGSGKSTLARLMCGLEAPDGGTVELCGMPMPSRRNEAWRTLRRKVQCVFQDPYASLDPLITVGRSVAEPLVNLTALTAAERDAAVQAALAAVRLPARMVGAHPYQLSGGERQRVCIARALVLRPDVVVCDEAVSALDAQTQVQIVDLLRELQDAYRLTYVFISHDIAIVSHLCAEVAVMKDGAIVEQGICRQVLQEPADAYTRQLIDAARYFERGWTRFRRH